MTKYWSQLDDCPKNLFVKRLSVFQDVHVMIFIGFGFLMTFLKKYGLSAVSLNLMCSALAIEIFTLVYGFFHLHCENPKVCHKNCKIVLRRLDFKIDFGSSDCPSSWPYIDVNVGTLISADFATAAVLISFGVVLGITSPLQLIIMTILETIIFVVNEVIGRDYIGAVDAGAYFGLTVAKALYNPAHAKVFLWIFWPSFNGATLAGGVTVL